MMIPSSILCTAFWDLSSWKSLWLKSLRRSLQLTLLGLLLVASDCAVSIVQWREKYEKIATKLLWQYSTPSQLLRFTDWSHPGNAVTWENAEACHQVFDHNGKYCERVTSQGERHTIGWHRQNKLALSTAFLEQVVFVSDQTLWHPPHPRMRNQQLQLKRQLRRPQEKMPPWRSQWRRSPLYEWIETVHSFIHSHTFFRRTHDVSLVFCT